MSVCNTTLDLTRYISGKVSQEQAAAAPVWRENTEVTIHNWTRWQKLAAITVSQNCTEVEQRCGPNTQIRKRRLLEPELLYGAEGSVWPKSTFVDEQLQGSCSAHNGNYSDNFTEACESWKVGECSHCCEPQCPALFTVDDNVTDTTVVNFIRETVRKLTERATNLSESASREDLKYVRLENIPVQWLHVDDDVVWLYDGSDTEHTGDTTTWQTGLLIVGEPSCTAVSEPIVPTIAENAPMDENKQAVVFGVVGLFLALACIYYCVCRQKRRKRLFVT